MQVKLITTIETIIEINPENTDDFEIAKREIFHNYIETQEDTVADDLKDAHQSAVIYDTVIAQSVTHSFEEVK